MTNIIYIAMLQIIPSEVLRNTVLANTTIGSKVISSYILALLLMKYTSYFSQLLKSNGCPHLSPDMFALYMNIVHLEGRIAELNDLANKAQQNDQKFVYRLKSEHIKDKILKLTNRLEPKEFLISIIENTDDTRQL